MSILRNISFDDFSSIMVVTDKKNKYIKEKREKDDKKEADRNDFNEATSYPRYFKGYRV